MQCFSSSTTRIRAVSITFQNSLHCSLKSQRFLLNTWSHVAAAPTQLPVARQRVWRREWIFMLPKATRMSFYRKHSKNGNTCCYYYCVSRQKEMSTRGWAALEMCFVIHSGLRRGSWMFPDYKRNGTGSWRASPPHLLAKLCPFQNTCQALHSCCSLIGGWWSRQSSFQTVQRYLNPSESLANLCQHGHKAVSGSLCVLFIPGTKAAL